MHAFQIIQQTWTDISADQEHLIHCTAIWLKKHPSQDVRAGDGTVACFKKFSSVLICHNRPPCSIDYAPPPSPDTRSLPHSTDLLFSVFSSRIFSAVQISSQDKISARVGYINQPLCQRNFKLSNIKIMMFALIIRRTRDFTMGYHHPRCWLFYSPVLILADPRGALSITGIYIEYLKTHLAPGRQMDYGILGV